MFTGCGGIGQCYAKVDVNFSLFCAAGRRVVGGRGWGMGGKELFLKVFVFFISPPKGERPISGISDGFDFFICDLISPFGWKNETSRKYFLYVHPLLACRYTKGPVIIERALLTCRC